MQVSGFRVSGFVFVSGGGGLALGILLSITLKRMLKLGVMELGGLEQHMTLQRLRCPRDHGLRV